MHEEMEGSQGNNSSSIDEIEVKTSGPVLLIDPADFNVNRRRLEKILLQFYFSEAQLNTSRYYAMLKRRCYKRVGKHTFSVPIHKYSNS